MSPHSANPTSLNPVYVSNILLQSNSNQSPLSLLSLTDPCIAHVTALCGSLLPLIDEIGVQVRVVFGTMMFYYVHACSACLIDRLLFSLEKTTVGLSTEHTPTNPPRDHHHTHMCRLRSHLASSL